MRLFSLLTIVLFMSATSLMAGIAPNQIRAELAFTVPTPIPPDFMDDIPDPKTRRGLAFTVPTPIPPDFMDDIPDPKTRRG